MDEGSKRVVETLASVTSTLADALSRTVKAHTPMTHAAIIVTGAAILDAELERCIKTKFRTLSGNMNARLFDYPGPFSTFAARIDLAYALDITNDEIHRELGYIRNIRNRFSHSSKLLTLDSDDVRPLYSALSGFGDENADPRSVFMTSINMINDYLERYLVVRFGITDDISEHNKGLIAPGATQV